MHWRKNRHETGLEEEKAEKINGRMKLWAWKI